VESAARRGCAAATNRRATRAPKPTGTSRRMRRETVFERLPRGDAGELEQQTAKPATLDVGAQVVHETLSFAVFRADPVPTTGESTLTAWQFSTLRGTTSISSAS